MKPSRLVTSGGVRRPTGRGRKKITKAAVLGGAATAAAAATVGMASPANASGYGYNGYDFVYHAANLGIDGVTTQVGWSICSEISAGWSQDAIAKDLVYHSFLGNGLYDHINYEQAYEEAYYAQQDLCPWTGGSGRAA
jgi:hypothetical protein